MLHDGLRLPCRLERGPVGTVVAKGEGGTRSLGLADANDPIWNG